MDKKNILLAGTTDENFDIDIIKTIEWYFGKYSI